MTITEFLEAMSEQTELMTTTVTYINEHGVAGRTAVNGVLEGDDRVMRSVQSVEVVPRAEMTTAPH